MLLCKKIKLEVSEPDAAALEFMQGKCRGLYNWLVMRLRAGERWHFAEEKAALKECRAYDPDLNEVYGKLLAEVYFRLDKAMNAFWKRLAAGGHPAGFPRVRPRHQFFTLCARLGPHTQRKRVRCAVSAGGGVAVKGTAQVQPVQKSTR